MQVPALTAVEQSLIDKGLIELLPIPYIEKGKRLRAFRLTGMGHAAWHLHKAVIEARSSGLSRESSIEMCRKLIDTCGPGDLHYIFEMFDASLHQVKPNESD